MTPESTAIAERYARRNEKTAAASSCPKLQEKQRATLKVFAHQFRVEDFVLLKLTEAGCSTRKNLLDFLLFGFFPYNLYDISLVWERDLITRAVLPNSLSIQESQDIVFQSFVFIFYTQRLFSGATRYGDELR